MTTVKRLVLLISTLPFKFVSPMTMCRCFTLMLYDLSITWKLTTDFNTLFCYKILLKIGRVYNLLAKNEEERK
jgi:hypothetical protein